MKLLKWLTKLFYLVDKETGKVLRCEDCGRKLTLRNYADSTGFAGLCYKCEMKILREEFGG